MADMETACTAISVAAEAPPRGEPAKSVPTPQFIT